MDRWILSELNRTAAAVVERMDQYDNFNACGQLIEFVDALSNWYVRRSRDRFWSGEHDADKSDAYWTLYECLLTTAKLIAPSCRSWPRNFGRTWPLPPSAAVPPARSPSRASICATTRPATRP